MKSISINPLLTLFVISLMVISCSQKDQPSYEQDTSKNQGQASVVDHESKRNILQIANSSDDHTTLAAAIDAAGIQNILVNAGPLTVFAPNNEAFDKLPEGTVKDLLKPENKQKLAKILTSHASPASLKMPQLTEGFQVYLATGQYVEVTKEGEDTYVNGAKILGTIEATNGVIHVVDKVFLF